MSIHEDFKIWWHNEGSGMPPANGEETCDHVERISEIAWHNGAYKANDALIEENARLKAEVERLRASSFVTAVPVEQYERVIKAGDKLVEAIQEMDVIIDMDSEHPEVNAWIAAKEGKQP